MNPLPPRLSYLQPFRKKFSSRPPEDLNEDTGMEPLFALLRKRITGHSAAEAEKLLAEDITELQNWLSLPEQQNDCLHFASGVFLIASPAEMVKQILEAVDKRKEPFPWIEMELPSGVKPRRFEKHREGGMLITWKGLLIGLSDIPEDGIARANETADKISRANRGQVTSSPVRFGGVSGEKHVEIGENRYGRPDKRIRYMLVVPGGHVEATINWLGKRPNANWDEAKMKEFIQRDDSKWDESLVETYFHSIRVTVKQP